MICGDAWPAVAFFWIMAALMTILLVLGWQCHPAPWWFKPWLSVVWVADVFVAVSVTVAEWRDS